MWRYLELEADRDGATKTLSEKEKDTDTQRGLREAGRPVSGEIAAEAGLRQYTPPTCIHPPAETCSRRVDGWMDSQAAGQMVARAAGPLVALPLSAHPHLDPAFHPDGLCV